MTVVEQLLAEYSFPKIIVILFLCALAFKEIFSLWDWGKSKLKSYFKKENVQEENKEEILERIDSLSKTIQEILNSHNEVNKKIDFLNQTVDTLIESDRDDIRAWITREHHYFCYQKGFIDDFSLDCIEKRYKHYKDEGGNSFITTLVGEIRDLPKVSKVDHSQEEEEERKNH